jgi:outer membrane protein TolC
MRATALAAGLCLLLALPARGDDPAAAVTAPRKALAECIEIALAHHPSLGEAAAAVRAGDARVWQAGSAYLPHANASYDASWQKTSLSARTGGSAGSGVGATPPTQRFSFFDNNVSLSQLLFDFGQNLYAIRSAQASRRSLEADAITQRDAVVLGVKQAYFNVLAARRLADVADETLRQAEQHLKLAQGRFDVGLAARFDVTQAQVQVSNARLNQLTARNNVAVALETLRNALGLSGPLDFDIVDTLDVHPTLVDESTALSAAYDHRPELRSVRERQEALEAQIRSLQRSYLPAVNGNAGYDWSANRYPLRPSWVIGASVNLSISNGGLTTSQIGEARANLKGLGFQEESLRQDIALEVRQDVLNLRQAQENIGVSQDTLRSADENLELAEGRYSTGVGSIIELTDAQASRASAAATHVQALYSYQTTLAALEKAMGTELSKSGSGGAP